MCKDNQRISAISVDRPNKLMHTQRHIKRAFPARKPIVELPVIDPMPYVLGILSRILLFLFFIRQRVKQAELLLYKRDVLAGIAYPQVLVEILRCLPRPQIWASARLALRFIVF